MRRFILRVVLFFGLLMALMAINYGLNRYFIQHTHLPLNQTQILILGDSHLATALDPAFLPNSENICQFGEPYLITYHKLKFILEQGAGSQIKTILLGFSPHNLAAFNDYKLSGITETTKLIERSYPLMNLTDYAVQPVDSRTYFKIWGRSMLLYPSRQHFSFIGQYEPQTAFLKSADAQAKLNEHYAPYGETLGQSAIALQYLEAIQSLSEAHDIELILVGAPLHTSYLAGIPEPIARHYEETKQHFKARGLTVLDYGALPLPDSLFFNHDHLNSNGAAYFTPLVAQAISANPGPATP